METLKWYRSQPRYPLLRTKVNKHRKYLRKRHNRPAKTKPDTGFHGGEYCLADAKAGKVNILYNSKNTLF